MGFQATNFDNDPAAKGIVSTIQTLQQVRDEQKKALFDTSNPASAMGNAMMLIAPEGGIISNVASEARKVVLKNLTMQMKPMLKDKQIPSDIARRRYLELHQVPDEYAPPKIPIELDPKLQSIAQTRTWINPETKLASRNTIQLSTSRVSPEGNSLLHEYTHARTGRGVGSDLEEQIRARAVHNINREYHKQGYKDTYSINPNENTGREVGMVGFDNLQEFTPGKRKIPVETLKNEYSESLKRSLEFTAFHDPNTTARGLFSTLHEFKSNPNIPKAELEKAEKSIIDSIRKHLRMK